MTCGIYRITNLKNGKSYIGQSSFIEHDLEDHRRSLHEHSHQNSLLQHDWLFYGHRAFEFYILEECEENNLDNKEVYWTHHFNSLDAGYNVDTVFSKDEQSANRGFKRINKEIRQVMGERDWFVREASRIIEPPLELSDSDVLSIFEHLIEGLTVSRIAKLYNTNEAVIFAVLERRIFSNVDLPVSYSALGQRFVGALNLSPTVRKSIRQYHEEGTSVEEIAKIFRTTRDVVGYIATIFQEQ
jgi:group I intron endonuclease